MSIENAAMFIVPIISLISLWGAHHISNRPKKEDSSHKRIETIIQSLEKQYERSEKRVADCENRYSKSCEENRSLRDDIRHYKRKLREVEKGGEKSDRT